MVLRLLPAQCSLKGCLSVFRSAVPGVEPHVLSGKALSQPHAEHLLPWACCRKLFSVRF